MPPKSNVPKSLSLKALVARLKDVQSSLGDIAMFAKNYVDGTPVAHLEVRLTKIDELWDSFSECLVDLRSHEEFVDDKNVYEGERAAFSNLYYDTKSFLTERLGELREPVKSEHSMQETPASMGLEHVRLPQIQLQTFNGDIDDWLSFRDLFASLIHWRTDLPDVEKFHYLKGCLQGEPKSLIDPLKITKANYQIAWETLTKRYNNNKLLKKKQVQVLFELPTMARESPSELHSVVDGFDRVVQTLDQVVQPSDYKDLLMVNLLTMRLDPITRRSWEEFSASREQDTFGDMLEFLRRRIQVLESLPSKKTNVITSQPNWSQLRGKPPAVKACNTAQSNGNKCVACQDSHLLYQCAAFRQLSVVERDKLLRVVSAEIVSNLLTKLKTASRDTLVGIVRVVIIRWCVFVTSAVMAPGVQRS